MGQAYLSEMRRQDGLYRRTGVLDLTGNYIKKKGDFNPDNVT